MALTLKVVDKHAFGADDFIGRVDVRWKELLERVRSRPAAVVAFVAVAVIVVVVVVSSSYAQCTVPIAQ